MATADNAAKARIGKLKKKAEKLGILVHDEMTEDVLKMAIAEATPEEDDAPKAAGFTKEDLLNLGKTIGESVANATNKSKEEQTEETYAEPDPSEEGEFKAYYTPTIFWLLPAKRVAGRLVMPPYGKIKFSLDRGNAVQVGSQWQTKYMSVYTTNNKKVQAFMESHPYFNKKFFLSEKEANITTDQVRYAEFFSKQFSALSNTMAPDLYSLGARIGAKMNHTMSLSTLRTVLAEKLADLDMAKHKEQTDRIMASTGRDALLTSGFAQ